MGKLYRIDIKRANLGRHRLMVKVKSVKPFLYTPLFIASALGLYSADAHNNTATNVVFDLGGVLFNISYKKMYYQLYKEGGLKFFYYLLIKRKNPRALLSEILDNIDLPDIEHAGLCDETGNPAPRALVHWLKGTISHQGIQNAVNDLLEKNSSYDSVERYLIEVLIHFLLNPKYIINGLSLNADGVAFVQECIKQGHKVFVLSNIDAESFDLLYQRHSDFFGLFDGVIASAKVNLVKPDPAIFYYLLDTYGLDPGRTVFIDDQKENVKAAEAVGIHAIHCQKTGLRAQHDFEAVRAEFDSWQFKCACNQEYERSSLVL